MKEKSSPYMFKGEGAATESAFNVRQAKDIPEPDRGKIAAVLGRKRSSKLSRLNRRYGKQVDLPLKVKQKNRPFVSFLFSERIRSGWHHGKQLSSLTL